MSSHIVTAEDQAIIVKDLTCYLGRENIMAAEDVNL